MFKKAMHYQCEIMYFFLNSRSLCYLAFIIATCRICGLLHREIIGVGLCEMAHCIMRFRGVREKVDKWFDNEYNVSSVREVAKIAMACVEFEGIKRPTMDSVSHDLCEVIRMESNWETMSITTHEVSLICSNLQVRWRKMWLSTKTSMYLAICLI